MKKVKRFLVTFVMIFLVVCFVGMAEVEKSPVAEAMVSSSEISWIPKVNYTKLILNISKPDGTIFSKTFDSGAAPYVNLSDLMGTQYIDGSYTYELCAIFVAGNKVRSGDSFPVLPRKARSQEALTQTGYFTVRGGMIVAPGAIEPGNVISTPQEGLSGTKDQVILDDLIVDGSLCVGMDCVNGESFGFDTIRLKENNLRIRFVDTSSTSSFPSRDWQITVNDSANGGANKFSIDDIDGGRTPFTIEAGAPSHSLYVDDGGRLGLGTSTPVVDAHIKTGNTPTLRLEQDGSSGFTPQTWDVAGNEANFFIRDATNGSELPFRIRPGAPSSSIDIDASGRVGIGTDSPSYAFHLKKSSAAQIVAEKDGNAIMELSSSTNYGIAGTKSNHPVQLRVNDQYIMELSGTSAAPIISMGDGLGSYSAGWNYSSSRELKANIKNLTAQEVMDALDHLTPVKYNYKIREGEQRVGFIAEDVPDLVAREDRKSLNPMDILGVLTKVVKEQQKTISELKKRITELEKKQQ